MLDQKLIKDQGTHQSRYQQETESQRVQPIDTMGRAPSGEYRPSGSVEFVSPWFFLTRCLTG
jgi:hypothetical protein